MFYGHLLPRFLLAPKFCNKITFHWTYFRSTNYIFSCLNWKLRMQTRFSATDSLGHSFPLRWPVFYSCQTQLQVRLLLSIYQHTANGLHNYKARQVSKKKKGWVDLLYDDESRYLYVLLLFWNMLRSCKSLFNMPATMVFWGKFPWIVRTSAVTQRHSRGRKLWMLHY